MVWQIATRSSPLLFFHFACSIANQLKTILQDFPNCSVAALVFDDQRHVTLMKKSAQAGRGAVQGNFEWDVEKRYTKVGAAFHWGGWVPCVLNVTRDFFQHLSLQRSA